MTSWVALEGNLSIQGDNIEFLPEEPKQPTTKNRLTDSNPPYSKAKCDTYFENGDITAKAFISQADSKIQFIFKSAVGESLFIGLNPQNHAYGIAARGGGAKFYAIDVVGSDIKAPINQWIDLRITVRGSRITLFINGVNVASDEAGLARAQVELVMQGHGEMKLKDINVKSKHPSVFVVMQFTEEYNALYNEVIKPICESYKYEVIRADNIYTNGLIIEDIANSIRESSLIIADITPNNPNVYYEIGFAHGIEKPTILLSDRKREKLPFDISGFRLLFYDNTIGGKPAVEAALRKHLDALLA